MDLKSQRSTTESSGRLGKDPTDEERSAHETTETTWSWSPDDIENRKKNSEVLFSDCFRLIKPDGDQA